MNYAIKYGLLGIAMPLFTAAAASAPENQLIYDIRFHAVKQPPTTLKLRAATKSFVLPRLNSPALDGSDRNWGDALSTDRFTVIYVRAVEKAKGRQAAGDWQNFMDITLPPSQPTAVKLGYDDQNLYLYADCHEKMMHKTSMPAAARRDTAVYGGDCLDILIAPDRHGTRCYQLVFNGRKSRYDAITHDKNNITTSDAAWNPDYKLWTSLEADRWRAVAAIPFKELGITPRDSGFFDINICRNELPFQEASSWGPVRKAFKERSKMVRLYFNRRGAATPEIDTVSFSAPSYGANPINVTVTNPTVESFIGLLTQDSSRGKDKLPRQIQKLTLAARQTQTFQLPLEIDRSGEYVNVLTLSKADGTPVSTGSFIFDAAGILTVKPSANDFLETDKSIALKVTANVSDPAQYGIRFQLGGRKRIVEPLKQQKIACNLALKYVKEKSVLTTELYSVSDGRTVATDKQTLTPTSDPFAE